MRPHQNSLKQTYHIHHTHQKSHNAKPQNHQQKPLHSPNKTPKITQHPPQQNTNNSRQNQLITPSQSGKMYIQTLPTNFEPQWGGTLIAAGVNPRYTQCLHSSPVGGATWTYPSTTPNPKSQLPPALELFPA